MGLPLFLLAIGSIFSGYFLEEVFVGFGSDFFIDSIFVLQNDFKLVEIEILSMFKTEKSLVFKLHPLQLTIIAIISVILKYNNRFLNITMDKIVVCLKKVVFYFNKVQIMIQCPRVPAADCKTVLYCTEAKLTFTSFITTYELLYKGDYLRGLDKQFTILRHKIFIFLNQK